MSANRDSEVFNWHYDTELDGQTLEIRGRKLFFIIVLFSIIFLFVALFVFARRICRQHGVLLPSVQPRHAPPPPPQQEEQQQQQGLDADAIKRLPIILHQAPPGPNRAAAETECCICLGAFVDGEKLKVLPGCDHSFHCECVDKWLANHSNCPLCRASLKLDSSFPRILIEAPPLRTSLLI
ncbi:RING-H2 finger protein ATL66 [Spatholobus suberectus]|nr:RING-H2 finger protein ATL66 [Spatholobus suberectus]